MSYIFALAFGVGVAAGLRSLTPPAVVAWAAHLGWLNLNNSPLAFMGSIITVVIFSILALFELFVDLQPSTPKRTAPVPLGARILMGAVRFGVEGCRSTNNSNKARIEKITTVIIDPMKASGELLRFNQPR